MHKAKDKEVEIVLASVFPEFSKSLLYFISSK